MAETMTMPQLNARHEALFEQLRLKREEVAELEAQVGAFAAITRGGLARHEAARYDRVATALPLERQKLQDLERAFAACAKAIEAHRAAARRAPMTAEEKALLQQALAYIRGVEEVERAAEALADRIRTAFALGGAVAAASGNAQFLRNMQLGYFRQRVTAGLLRVFEMDPKAGGTWGQHGALLQLGNAGLPEIVRRGLVDYERGGLRDLMPPNIGAAI